MRALNRLVVLCVLASAGRAEAGGVTAAPPSVAFGKIAVGVQTQATDVVLTNGGALTQLTSLSVVGQHPGDFVITANPAPVALGMGASVTVSVAFAPLAGGSRLGTLEAVLGGGVVLDVPLSGTGVGPALTITPNPIGFWGGRLNVPRTLTVTVANSGGGVVKLPPGAVRLGGPNAGELTLLALPALPASLGAGESVTVQLGFVPTFAGLHSATLDIDNDDPQLGPTVHVPVSGRGGDPALRPSVVSAAFGGQRVDLASDPLPIDLLDAGNADLTVAGMTLGGANPGDFVLAAPVTPFVVATQGSVPVGVTFKPTAVGPRSATLIIASDDPKAPNTVINLGGVGTFARLSATPGRIDFASVPQYLGSAPASVVVKNDGNAAAVIKSLDVTGAQAAWFRYDGLTRPPITVPAMGSVKLDFIAIPLEGGPGAGTLTIGTDEPSAPAFDVTLSANGVHGTASVDPPFGDFGVVAVGARKKLTFTVRNTGTDNLVVDTFHLDDPNQAFYPLDPLVTPVTMDIGAAVTFDVEFAPPGPGLFSGELDLDFLRDPLSRHLHLPLDGVGATVGGGVTPASLGFGTLVVGQQSAPQAFSVANGGDLPLRITQIALGGTNPNQFLLIGGEVPFVLPPGGKRMVQVAYAPISGGTHAAVVSVTGDGGFAPATVRLAGTGVAQQLLVSPATLDFGDVLVGLTSPPQSVAVKVPAGAPPLVIRAITSSSADYLVDSAHLATSLAPAAVSSFEVLVAPQRRGASVGTISIYAQGQSTPIATVTAKANGYQSVGIIQTQPGKGCSVGGRASPAPLAILLTLLALALSRRRPARG